MKNLLGVIGTLAIVGSSPTLLVTNHQQVKQSEVYAKSFDWNEDHSSKTITITTDWKNAKDSKQWFTFNLGSNKSFSSISLMGSDGFSFSWGDTRYGPWKFDEHAINLDYSHEAKITNSNFNQHLDFLVYDKEVNDFLAKFHSIVKIGYAWYQESGNYYFQFLIYQYINPINSFSGGGSWANLGTGIYLS